MRPVPLPSPASVSKRTARGSAPPIHAAVASALSVIPNDNLNWNDWNRIGMATWAATDGSEVGREAFSEWSAKSSKNDKDATEARWQHYRTSPPTGSDLALWSTMARTALAGMDIRKRKDTPRVCRRAS